MLSRCVTMVTENEYNKSHRTAAMSSWQQEVGGFPRTDGEPEDADRGSVFDAVYGNMREKIVLQRLITVSRLPHSPADRTELGAHYENLNFQLSKQYIRDHITGLLLIYPSCVLHITESSRDILTSVLRDLEGLQQQPHRPSSELRSELKQCSSWSHCLQFAAAPNVFLGAQTSTLLEAKIAFVDHSPERRLFQQWSYKVLDAGQMIEDPAVKTLEDEASSETLVCRVLSALQNLSEQLETSQAVPGSVLDKMPELIVHQNILERLLLRDELLSPKQYLQMYTSTSNSSIQIGQMDPVNFLRAV